MPATLLKFMDTILSNSIRKMPWYEINKMPSAVYKIIVLFIITCGSFLPYWWFSWMYIVRIVVLLEIVAISYIICHTSYVCATTSLLCHYVLWLIEAQSGDSWCWIRYANLMCQEVKVHDDPRVGWISTVTPRDIGFAEIANVQK